MIPSNAMRYILTLIFIFANLTLYSQECDISINETFDSVPLIEFIESIEKTTDVKFYVKTEWIKETTITNTNSNSNLHQILESNLKNTSLKVHIYHCNTVVITNNYIIEENIPQYVYSSANQTTSSQTLKFDESSFIKLDYQSNQQNNSSLITIGDPSYKDVKRNATISGYLKDTVNDVPIVGAVIFFNNLESATVTNANGFYSISVEKGKNTMHIQSVGKKEKQIEIELFSDGTLNETLEDEAVSLQEVYVYVDKEHNVRNIQLGLEKLDANTIKQIPSSAGEPDILKSTILLPGVQTVGEGASGFNVRGGSVDQNLVLIDNAPIYNTSHLFGFFSAINTEMVNELKLYKSSYPSSYGGRLSSIFDVKLKKGNADKFSMSGGISPITGKILIEGPLAKEKISYIVSGRSTYSDWLLKRINSPVLQNSEASFYDINAKINYDINRKNWVQIGAYKSSDNFKLNSDTTYTYKNLNGNLLWKHKFNDRLYLNTTGVFSNYNYNIGSNAAANSAFDLMYDIKHYEIKTDLTYRLHEYHKLSFGANSIYYQLNPGELNPASNISNLTKIELDNEQGIESAIYINDEYQLSNRLSFNLGFRYSFYHSLGPAKVYRYSENSPKNAESRVDSSMFGKNSITARYANPEIRVSARYQLFDNNSIKASFTQMTQYIHMLSNTMSVSPTDIWKLSDPHIEPQKSNQYSLGYYHNLHHNMFETSVEGYLKDSKNLLEYKPGAELILNSDLETDLLAGDGKAYGIEFMVRKKYGKLNGWFSYTYSRSLIKVDSEHAEEKINDGNYFPTNYDKPHDFTIVSNYKISRRISFSGTMTYNTGRPITYPVSWYSLRDRQVLHYSDRNEYRIPDYFRFDIAINIEGNLKIKKLAHSSWTFSVYNLTGRDNVYSIYFVSDKENNLKGYKLSIFSEPMPSLTYHFKF